MTSFKMPGYIDVEVQQLTHTINVCMPGWKAIVMGPDIYIHTPLGRAFVFQGEPLGNRGRSEATRDVYRGHHGPQGPPKQLPPQPVSSPPPDYRTSH